MLIRLFCSSWSYIPILLYKNSSKCWVAGPAKNNIDHFGNAANGIIFILLIVGNMEQMILIAEDDHDDRFLLKLAFEENGFHDTLCFLDNGVALLETLNELLIKHQTLPHLVIMDMNMPKKGGAETLIDIRKHPELGHIPVVIFSTTVNEQEQKKCLALGANAYIPKPNSYEKLIQAISEMKKIAGA
jgi:two-component system response regulator